MSEITLPPSYSFGKVVGRVIHAIADTDEDVDDKPQARAAAGKVTFAPQETLRVVTTAGHESVVTQGPVSATLSATGRLLDGEGRQGVWLVAGVYKVSFQLDAVPANGTNVARSAPRLPEFEITVTDAHTDAAPLDLASMVPYTPPTGVSVRTVLIPQGGEDGQALIKSGDGVTWGTATGGGTTLTSYDQVSTLADYPTTFPADLTGYVQDDDERLSDARTPTTHQHTAAQISDATTVGRSVLQAADATAARGAINAAAVSHNHSGTYQPVGDYATLVGGVIPTSQIPALALTSTNVVASQAAMLALSNVQTGDIAVRTDGAGTFILSGANPAQIGSWTLLSSPTDAVTSVNGQTGAITLSAANVGAAPTTRQVNSGTGLTGGGDLSANRSLSVQYGTTAGTAAQGNDARLSDARTPTTHSHNVADLPAGSVIRSTNTTRPTDRTDIMVIFTGADPGANALTGDVWLGG